MKNFLLKSMLLVSHREKKAKKIEFHPQTTIIQGANDTGKSSVIKSIYYAFGATPHKRHKKWIDADIIILIGFSVDGINYFIYRHRNSFTLFDSNKNEIGTYASITNELAPVLSNIFDFKLKLVDRRGSAIIPPPAYLLLPFYIDQDKGWTDSWCSFTKLEQFSRWKNPVSGYHFGLKPDKWYELEANKKNLESDREEPNRQITSINSIRERVYKEFARIDFNIDVGVFKKDIENLLDKCRTLKNSENKYRKEISELKTDSIRLEAQIEIVARTREELNSDYDFSCSHLGESVDCPTCGANYSNSFSERFAIAQDTETCTDLLASLSDDLRKVKREILETDKILKGTVQTRKEINQILSKKQGNLKLKDLIELESKKRLIEHLNSETKNYQSVIENIDTQILEMVSRMKEFDDPERRKEIIAEYGEALRKNTQKLHVFSLGENVFKSITPSIEESGSDLPRGILAYFFTAIKAIESNGNATFFPIVIDAPNQQEQDPENLKLMLEFIAKNRPKGRQLIVGLVDDAGVQFEGKRLMFEKKYSVLKEELYSTLSEELRYFENINIGMGTES